MTGYVLKPGDPVRFCKQDVGVVELVKEDGTAYVFFLEWVGRNLPVLTRRHCALDGLEHVSLNEYMSEIRPATCRQSWRNRLARAIDALRGY